MASQSAVPSKLECVASSSQGQEDRDAGKLIGARDSFRVCAASSCPDVVRQACAEWLADVEERVPAVTLAVKHSDGRDALVDQVLADGEPSSDLLGGRSINLDPGKHEFVVMAEGQRRSVTFLLRERETSRRIVIEFPAEQPTVERDDPSFPWVPVLTGTGAVLMGTSVGFGLWVKSDRDRCAPSCTDDEVDSLKGRLIGGEVLLGASVLSLGAAAVLLFTRGRDEEPPQKTGLHWTPIVGQQGFGAQMGTDF